MARRARGGDRDPIEQGGPGGCESLVRALGPDARSLRPYLQRHLAVPGVAMREDLFECLLDELPRWPAAQLGADLGRIAQLAERATPADGPAQAQMLRLLWSAPAQRLPGDVARRARDAGRALLGRATLPEPVVRRYEALFEDGRRSAEARDVARLLAEHAFDCRHAPPGDSKLDRLPATSARHALVILSHFARSRSCAGSTLMPLPDEASAGQLVWQAASLFDHGYPKSLGLQESEAADYSRARTLEKERAYNDMLRFVRESMRNASLSSLSLELMLKIGIDVASNCQPPGSTVSLIRGIITELQRRGGISPENNRVFSHLLTSFQRQKNCTKVSIRDLINAHDYLVPQLLEDFQKSVLFESPSVRAYLVTELSIYAKMAHQIPAERRVALLGVATALLTISWPPGKVLDLLIDSASLLQFGSISRQMARKMIPALLRIHTRPYYEWLSPKRKSYLYLTLLRLIEQLDKMDDSILVAIETVVASPCEKLNLVSVLFRMLETPTVSSKAFSYIECLILYLLKVPRWFKIDWSVIIIPTAPNGPCHPRTWHSTTGTTELSVETTPKITFTETPSSGIEETSTPGKELTTRKTTAYSTTTPTESATTEIETTTETSPGVSTTPSFAETTSKETTVTPSSGISTYETTGTSTTEEEFTTTIATSTSTGYIETTGSTTVTPTSTETSTTASNTVPTTEMSATTMPSTSETLTGTPFSETTSTITGSETTVTTTTEQTMSQTPSTETTRLTTTTETPEVSGSIETTAATEFSTLTTTSTERTSTTTELSSEIPTMTPSIETTTSGSTTSTSTPAAKTPSVETTTSAESTTTSTSTQTPTGSYSLETTTTTGQETFTPATETSTSVTHPQQTTAPPRPDNRENDTTTPTGFRSTIVTTDNILSMGTTVVTLPTPTPALNVFTVPSFPESATVKFNIEKISHHITHTNESTGNILKLIETISNWSHPKDIPNIIEGAHNITIGHPEIERAVDERLIQIIVKALTAEQLRGITTDRTERLVLELYRILKTGVRIDLSILRSILTLKMTATLRENIILSLVNRTYHGPTEEVHRVLEILLPYLAVHHVSTLTTKEFIHLLVQYVQTTNRSTIDGDLRHFLIEILEELTRNPKVPENQKQRLIAILEMLLKELPAPRTKFSAIHKYLQNPKAPLPYTLLLSIQPNPRGTAPGSPATIQALASVVKESAGNPVVVGNVVSLLLRLISTNNVPRLQIGPLLTSLNKIVHRRDLIAPHLRMIALTDSLILYGNDGFQYLSPTARSTVLTTLVSLLSGRVDDYLVTRLLSFKPPNHKPGRTFETLRRDVDSVKPNGPVEGLTAVKEILLVLGSIVARNPSSPVNLHDIAAKLNSHPPEESKYPRSIQYIIASLLKKTPVQVSAIPKSAMTPLSYVHWPTYELPPDLVDNIAKEVEDRDYKITHLTKELSLDLVSPALDPTVRGNLLVVAMRLLTTDQMTVTLAQQLLRAIHAAVTLVPSLWPRNSLLLLQDIPTAITRPIIRSLPPIQTAILPSLLHHMINRVQHIPKPILDTLIKFAPSQDYAVEIVTDIISALLKHSDVHEQANLSNKLVKVLDERAGTSALPIKEVADLLTHFRNRLSRLAKGSSELKSVIKYINEVLRRLQSEPLSALRNLKKYLRTLPGPAPVELVRNIFEDFPSWTPNDLQTVVSLVRDALTAARSREPEVVGSVAAVAMRLLRLYNYTDGTEKRLVDVIDRVPVRDDIIPQPLKLVLVNDILFVLATKVTQKSESNVNVQTLLRLLDTVLRGGALPTGTASVEGHFIKAVAAFVDNKFALRKVTRELRVRIADLLRRLDLQQYIPLEIVVKIDKQLRKEMWTVIRKVHTTTEERSITQFLQYLKTANRDEIVRMDEGSMRNLPKVMLPLPPRALRNVIAGVEDVLKFNHEIIHRDLARQLLTIVQTAISSPMFPATLLPRSKSVMDALKRDIRHESARGGLYPPAM
ncbi:hypothetical protein HPB49_020511 [Dermacentor silvarum]|uniref:Uncharacterized protein n=1 Tax=Dermacentor silvarum TaxID=543639 RepID=A0ACB8E2Q8_DERSI|nr:hypothetical protein HPB49_020511 [Dermacentor silvarum]